MQFYAIAFYTSFFVYKKVDNIYELSIIKVQKKTLPLTQVEE